MKRIRIFLLPVIIFVLQFSLFGISDAEKNALLKLKKEFPTLKHTLNDGGKHWIDVLSILDRAAMNGHRHIANYIFKQQPKISKKNLSRALSVAIFAHSQEIVQILLDKGADIHMPDAQGVTPIFYAASAGNGSAFKLLFQKGARIDTTDKYGNTIYHYLAGRYPPIRFAHLRPRGISLSSQSHSGAYNAKIVQDAKQTNRRFKKSETSLVSIAQICRKFVDSPCRKNKFGETPLFRIHSDESVELAKFFISAGCDLNSINRLKRNALLNAILRKQKQIALELVLAGSNIDQIDRDHYTPLLAAIRFNMTDLGLLLIKRGADLNYKSRDKKTALIYAVQYKNKALTREMLRQDVNINARDRKGGSALYYLLKNRWFDLANSFKSKYAALDISIPFRKLIEEKHFDTVAYLFDNDYFNGITKKQSIACFHTLFRHQNLTFTIRLYEYLNNTKYLGDISLPLIQECARKGTPEIARFLESKGLSFERKTHPQQSTLYQSVRHSNVAMVRYLLEKGISVKNDHKQSDPLLKITSNSEIKELLVRYGAKSREEIVRRKQIMRWRLELVLKYLGFFLLFLGIFFLISAPFNKSDSDPLKRIPEARSQTWKKHIIQTGVPLLLSIGLTGLLIYLLKTGIPKSIIEQTTILFLFLPAGLAIANAFIINKKIIGIQRRWVKETLFILHIFLSVLPYLSTSQLLFAGVFRGEGSAVIGLFRVGIMFGIFLIVLIGNTSQRSHRENSSPSGTG